MPAASLACGLRSVPANRRSGRRNGTRRALLLSETLPYNSATGGTVSEFIDAAGKRRRVHAFTASSTLVLAWAARTCRALVVGGGNPGSGGGWNVGGWGGNGGKVIESDVRFPMGAIAVTVGAVAQDSSVGPVSSSSGASAAGGSGAPYNTPGGAGANGTASSITGTSVRFGGAGGGGGGSHTTNMQPGGAGGAGGGGNGGRGAAQIDPNYAIGNGSAATANSGGGGGGGGGAEGDTPAGVGGAGASGAVYVSYEIPA